MKLRALLLFVLLPVSGCGVVADGSVDTNAALTDADFDGWRGPESRASSSDAQGSQVPQPATPSAQGSLLNGVVDRVIAHVDSVDAKVHFKQSNGTWQATVETTPQSRDSHRSSPQPSLAAKAVVGPHAGTKNTPPPPAPPAESLALTQDQATTVETLDIPKGWTGAAVYHAASCQHCPALLAALRSRASRVSGNYLMVDGCWFRLVDWDERPDIDRPKIPGLPAVLFFVDGHERLQDRVVGFGSRPGELDTIISRHPHFPKRSQVQANPSYGAAFPEAAAMPMCPCGPACGCLSGMTTASPLWYELPSHCVTTSAGISLFGMPIVNGSIGTYPMTAR